MACRRLYLPQRKRLVNEGTRDEPICHPDSSFAVWLSACCLRLSNGARHLPHNQCDNDAAYASMKAEMCNATT